MNDGSFCAVCGETATTHWRTAPDNLVGGNRTFTAVRCVRCGLVRLSPRPDADTMGRAYAASTYARAEGDDRTVELGKRLDRFFEKQADRAVTAYGSRPPGRLLDVGCGDGRFLDAMQQRGWRVEGLETDPVAAGLARRRTESVIHEAYLEDASIPAAGFEMVSLLHVLEHVPDPRETLTAAFRALKPDGMLLLALPNVASVEAELFGVVWYPLDLPRHYWGFTPHTLVRLAEECGGTVTGLRYFPFLFAPQSVRYILRGAGTGSGLNAGARTEAGGLRTWLFDTLLRSAESVGGKMPGEVMELTALRAR
ncbi:MAG: class I SAM-dependent methyltransferase [Capsulimonadales bacterium]|nr:class I SAM-dependent methyltransferase [Capsulimonadales bacterium]